MRKSLKIFAGALALSTVIAALPSCARSTTGGDSTKLQLEIGAYEGALGGQVSEETIARFEEKYAEQQFGNKKGIEVNVRPSGNYLGTQVVGASQNYPIDIYITEDAYYYDLVKGGNGDALEITDVVTSSFQYDFVTKQTDTSAENTTFKSKMFDTDIAYLNVGENGTEKYYAVPTRQSFYGIWYNVNMFDENGWYFADNTSLSFSMDGTKSLGSDNLPNTFDDGLPATYEQFYALCAAIASPGKRAAIVYPGTHMDYTTSYLTSLWADYEGTEELMNCYDFDGTSYDIITGFDDKGNPIINQEGVTITPENGYIPHEKQAGKYYALEFAYKLAQGSNYLYKNYDLTQYTSQRAFIANYYDSNVDCAMLMDGSWWTYEARNDIARIESSALLPGEELKYGFMPFPKAHASQIGEKQTIIDYNYTMMFISSSIDKSKIDAAKAFVQFYATEESLKEYVKQYGSLPEYKMNVEKGDDFYNGLSYFTKNLFDVREGAEIVVPVSNNPTYKNLGSQINAKYKVWSDQVPFTTFLTAGNKKTPKDLFEKLSFEGLF